jgi:hypothetical protein
MTASHSRAMLVEGRECSLAFRTFKRRVVGGSVYLTRDYNTVNICMIANIKNFYSKYGFHYIKIWTWHLLAIACLVTMDPILLVYAFLVFLLIFPLFSLVFHEYISHEYITPRNQLVKMLTLLLWYMFGQPIQGKKNYHIWHHRTWNDAQVDPTQQLLEHKSLFRYLFSLHSPLQQSIPKVESGNLVKDHLIQLLDSKVNYIYWASILLMLLLLSWPMFVVLRVYVPWFMTLASKYHDWYFHGNGLRKDSIWLLPIYSSASWHIEHHTNWQQEYHGTGLSKMFNLSWIFRKILFK